MKRTFIKQPDRNSKKMTLTRQMEDGEFTPITPGTYTVTCTDVKEGVIENPAFGNGDIIRFTVSFDDLLDTEGAEVIRDAIANDKLTPMSKLTEWLIAFGVSATVGESLDIEECMGRKALAKVTNVEKNDKTYDRITSLLPSPKAATRDTEVDVSGAAHCRVVDICPRSGLHSGPRQSRAMAAEMYDGREPKDLDGKEREAVFAALCEELCRKADTLRHPRDSSEGSSPPTDNMRRTHEC